jgi:anti-sigma factor ChrR (cupin superfamily)
MTRPPLEPTDLYDVLQPAWVAALAQGLGTADGATLSAPSAAAMKARLMQRISAQAVEPIAHSAHIVSIMRDDAWVQLGKKVHVKVLHDDGTTLSWLLKLLPGGRLPEHDHHDGAEECMVLEGQLRINGAEFGCGDYQIAHPGSSHFEVMSEQGALVFLKSPSARRRTLFPV